VRRDRHGPDGYVLLRQLSPRGPWTLYLPRFPLATSTAASPSGPSPTASSPAPAESRYLSLPAPTASWPTATFPVCLLPRVAVYYVHVTSWPGQQERFGGEDHSYTDSPPTVEVRRAFCVRRAVRVRMPALEPGGTRFSTQAKGDKMPRYYVPNSRTTLDLPDGQLLGRIRWGWAEGLLPPGPPPTFKQCDCRGGTDHTLLPAP
jgi:hypothetical protein